MAGKDRRKQSLGTELSHIDERGRARMVDVGEKSVTERVAVAAATVRMKPQTLGAIRRGGTGKGEVLAVARVAGVMAAKRTSELIPLCHSLSLDSVNVEFDVRGRGTLEIRATARVHAKTGVEMEALTAVTVAALTVYDMCKAIDRGMRIVSVRLLEKRGGRSGSWKRRAT